MNKRLVKTCIFPSISLLKNTNDFKKRYKNKVITKTASCDSDSDVKNAKAARKYGSVNFSLVLEHDSRHMLYLSGL